MRLDQLRRLEKQQLGKSIPLHTRFTARDYQVVGTTDEYMINRNLRIAQGRSWKMPGECAIGYSVADRLELEIGDKIPVTESSAFILRDAPLRLRVVGVLEATETPDDEVIFTDLDTTWIIEGLGHGHVKSAQHGSPEAQLYTDITNEKVGSFHFHGDRGKFPITAIIVIPENDRAETILLGQFLSPDETVQIVRPRKVMDTLLARVVMIRSYLLAAITLISAVTVLMMTLVIVLSIRLRRAEIVTMSKMGCARHKIASILGSQIALVFAASVAIAAMLTLVTNQYGPELVRFFVL